MTKNKLKSIAMLPLMLAFLGCNDGNSNDVKTSIVLEESNIVVSEEPNTMVSLPFSLNKKVKLLSEDGIPTFLKFDSGQFKSENDGKIEEYSMRIQQLGENEPSINSFLDNGDYKLEIQDEIGTKNDRLILETPTAVYDTLCKVLGDQILFDGAHIPQIGKLEGMLTNLNSWGDEKLSDLTHAYTGMQKWANFQTPDEYISQNDLTKKLKFGGGHTSASTSREIDGSPEVLLLEQQTNGKRYLVVSNNEVDFGVKINTGFIFNSDDDVAGYVVSSNGSPQVNRLDVETTLDINFQIDGARIYTDELFSTLSENKEYVQSKFNQLEGVTQLLGNNF